MRSTTAKQKLLDIPWDLWVAGIIDGMGDGRLLGLDDDTSEGTDNGLLLGSIDGILDGTDDG